jgi:hypothetical protein
LSAVELNGVYPDLPRERYDELDGRVNFSTAKAMGKSPAHYAHALTHRSPDTEPRKMGRLAHLAVFEPAVYARTVRTSELNRNSNAFKDFLEMAVLEGCEVIKEADHRRLMSISDAVRKHPVAGRYASGGQSEVTLLWTHRAAAMGALPGYELDCRARLDHLKLDEFVSDLKVVRDASPDGFGRACCDYRTFTQAAEYSDAVEALTGKRLPYYLLAVENFAPFAVQVYQVPQPILDMGRDEYRGWFDRIHACRRDNRWPEYAEGVLELGLPRWAMPQDDDSDLTEAGLIFPKE